MTKGALLIGQTVNQMDSTSNQIKCWFFEEKGNPKYVKNPLGAELLTEPTNEAESGNRIEPGTHLVEGEYSYHCANSAPLWSITY